jgi:gp16 family phage-associated protein
VFLFLSFSHNAMTQRTRTAQEVRDWLAEHGVSQREAAERIGVKYQTVRNLLRKNGQSTNKGLRGEAFRAAVALGLRPAPEGQSPRDVLKPAPAPRRTGRRHAPPSPGVAGEPQ